MIIQYFNRTSASPVAVSLRWNLISISALKCFYLQVLKMEYKALSFKHTVPGGIYEIINSNSGI